MERSEDLKQVRDLRLVRDERDREVEAEAGRRAGNALLLVTQLLAAACLLQGDPAWMALLSLTFIWGAVKGFCRFGQDREKLYLAWGLLTAAGAPGRSGHEMVEKQLLPPLTILNSRLVSSVAYSGADAGEPLEPVLDEVRRAARMLTTL